MSEKPRVRAFDEGVNTESLSAKVPPRTREAYEAEMRHQQLLAERLWENIGKKRPSKQEIRAQYPRFFENVRTHRESNGSRITLYGASHLPETWLAQGEQLLHDIHESDVIILETTPSTLTQEEALAVVPEVLKLLPPVLRMRFSNKKERLAEILSHGDPYTLDAIGFRDFFVSAANIAAVDGKQILGADPYFAQRDALYGAEALSGARWDKDKEMRSILALAHTLTVALPASIAIHAAWKLLTQDQTASTHDQSVTTTTTSRRQVLKLLGGGALVAIVAPVRPKANYQKPEVPTPHITFEEVSNAYYGNVDFRDNTVARAIEEYTRRFPGKKVLVLYGANHIPGIANYLDQPLLSSAKGALYAPYKEGPPSQVSEFKRDAQGKWRRIPLFDIK